MKASYLAIDPGHMNGWATFDAQGGILKFGQFRMEVLVAEVGKIISENDIEHIIIEDYRNRAYGNFRQTAGGRNETSKMVAKVETLAELNSIPVTLQPNTAYNIGAMWGGFQIPSNHSISHQYVAMAHGIYWLQQNGIREIGQNLKERENGN